MEFIDFGGAKSNSDQELINRDFGHEAFQSVFAKQARKSKRLEFDCSYTQYK